MKLQVKVLGQVNNISSTTTKVTVYGRINALELYNGVCHDSYFKLPSQYASITFIGKDLEFFNFGEEIVVSGDINELQFKENNGQIVKQYYIPECIIQLIDVDQEPEDELFD
jgi:hypothetical protein